MMWLRLFAHRTETWRASPIRLLWEVSDVVYIRRFLYNFYSKTSCFLYCPLSCLTGPRNRDELIKCIVVFAKPVFIFKMFIYKKTLFASFPNSVIIRLWGLKYELLKFWQYRGFNLSLFLKNKLKLSEDNKISEKKFTMKICLYIKI